MSKGTGGRRAGRMLAFQILFGRGFEHGGDDFDHDLAVLDEHEPRGKEFARSLVRGVDAHREELDRIIESLSQHWKLKRIAKVELAILRLALYEMRHTDMPMRAAINEAVELSKRFGDENSRSFINGILDAAAKSPDLRDPADQDNAR